MKPIHFEDEHEAIERLPYPIVLYPTHYGSFLAFKEQKRANPKFCACSLEAIENYVKVRLAHPDKRLFADSTRQFILDSFHFPREIVIALLKKNTPQDIAVLNYLNFGQRLCHECNQAIPTYRYCHEMYGTTFVQNYGWYINKQLWQYSVDPMSFVHLEEECPQSIVDIFGSEWKHLEDEHKGLLASGDIAKANRIAGLMHKIGSKVRRFAENEVRTRLGHKKIGETWTSETILYYIVKRLFPKQTIRRHYRPDFLDKLELDIFIEEFQLGIEYQGIQHFKPIKHWGGLEALKATKERDGRKKALCSETGIHLLYFTYEDNLSEEKVENEIRQLLGPALE